MSNEEFEKTIKEYNEQKNEQLKRDTLNNFHKKMMIENQFGKEAMK